MRGAEPMRLTSGREAGLRAGSLESRGFRRSRGSRVTARLGCPFFELDFSAESGLRWRPEFLARADRIPSGSEAESCR